MDTDEAYEILQLSPPVSDDEINSAYRELTKKYHPDVTGGETREHWMRIDEAKEILLERSRRTARTSDQPTAGTTGRTTNSATSGNESHRERSYTQNRRARQRRTTTTHGEDTQQSAPTGDEQSTSSPTPESPGGFPERLKSVGSSITTAGLAVLLFPGIVANTYIPWYFQIGALIGILFGVPWDAGIPQIFFFLSMLFLTIGGIALLGLLTLYFLVQGQLLVTLALVLLLGIFSAYYWFTATA